MVNMFDILKKMSADNMDIVAAPPSNFKRANTGKDGYGELTMAVANTQILRLNEYAVILFLVNKEQLKQLQKG